MTSNDLKPAPLQHFIIRLIQKSASKTAVCCTNVLKNFATYAVTKILKDGLCEGGKSSPDIDRAYDQADFIDERVEMTQRLACHIDLIRNKHGR